MSKAKRGKYVIGEGIDFKTKTPSNGIGYDYTLDSHSWFVVDSSNGKILGQYTTRELAVQCAIFLDKIDHEKLDKEMEKILRET